MLITLCFLVFSCELFNATEDPDFWQKLDEEIAWANAAKLTVRVEYPSEWGITNPQQGTIAPGAMDIRKGFPFTIEFTPDQAYTLSDSGWTAYYTADIERLNDEMDEGNTWMDDPKLLSKLNALGGSEITMPNPNSGSGKFTFTIHTTKAVTLIPDCGTELRILRTEPRLPRGENTQDIGLSEYPRGTTINIFFNTQLDSRTVNSSTVLIKAKDYDSDTSKFSNYYRIEDFDTAGLYGIALIPRTGALLPPGGYRVEVTLLGGDEGIHNLREQFMSVESVTYSWKTKESASATITGWSAEYDEENNTIEVDWEVLPPSANVRVLYSLNQGRENQIANDDRIIPRVGSIDTLGVKDGRSVSGVQEYEITISILDGDIIERSESFKIWNIPGMDFAHDNTVYVSGADDAYNPAARTVGLRNIGSLPEEITNIILVNSFSVSNWEPVDFTDRNFYGNGHTITISGLSGSAADMGLFGVVDGGLVRDLTVQYGTGAALSIPTSARQFGGIAGTTQGTAQLVNVQSRGSITMGGSGFTAYAGGLVGQMTGTGTEARPNIYNSYGGLNLNVNTNPGTEQSLYVGGIAGSMGRPNTGDPVRVEKVTVEGNILVGQSEIINAWNAADFLITFQGIHVGGLVGIVRGAGNLNSQRVVLINSDYKDGNIRLRKSDGRSHFGGAIGSIVQYANITDCSANANELDFITQGQGATFVGGFLGVFWTSGTITNCYSENHIEAKMTIDYPWTMAVGGFAARLDAEIEYCYAKGNVSATSYYYTYVGGFAGQYTGNRIANCYATGNVSANSTTNVAEEAPPRYYAGGFVGFFDNNGYITDSYSTGNVESIVTSSNTRTLEVSAGGLVGHISLRGNIINCFAGGSVTAHRNRTGGDIIDVGGLIGNAGSGSGSITNNAALGASVTAAGTDTKNIGRISGRGTGTHTNNRAFDAMRLFSDTYANRLNPAPVSMGTRPLEHNTQDGRDARDSDFRRQDIWSFPASTNPSTFHGLGFDPARWDFSTVSFRGHPVLRGVGGIGLLGGQ
jgi:3D (Asp-Asp-Asp) domain-containing protein